MSNSIMLDDAAIRKAIKSLETSMNGIIDINKSMTVQTNKLFSCWEGSSKKEFKDEYDKINSKTFDLSTALGDMKEDLKCIADTFENADIQMKLSIVKQQ